MPFITLPAGVKVAMEYEAFGKIVVNIYHVTSEDPITSIVLFDIAVIFSDWWSDALKLVMSEDVKLVNVTALDISIENGEKVETAIVPPEAGTVAAEGVPNNVAIVASFATAKTGRSFQGRAFLAGIPEPSVTGNVIGPIKQTEIVAAYAALAQDLSLNNFHHVVASFQTNQAPRAVGVSTVITSYAVDARVDTQRRRLPRA